MKRAGFVLLAMVAVSAPALARRQPPPAVIPTEETQKARDLYKVGRYGDAVTAAKAVPSGAVDATRSASAPATMELRVDITGTPIRCARP